MADAAPEPTDFDSGLYEVVESFLRTNCHFESTAAIEALLEDVQKAPDIDQMFLAPIKHKMLAFSEALLWAFFLHHAHDRLREEHGVLAPVKGPLDLVHAFETLRVVFDIATQNAVWEHFEPLGSDSSETVDSEAAAASGCESDED